jgi:hypothetical protein
MYSEEIISTLTERIGFGTPNEEGFPIELEEANSIGSSGRLFSSFHSLVTIENIHAAVQNADIEEGPFNDILENYRKAAVLEVVPLIMDKNDAYDNAVDYSTVMQQNIILFDDAIGYKVAMMVLEMFMASSRSNLLERNAKFSVSNLKLELEGYKNETGVLVAKGLVQKFERSIVKASNKIFPRVIEIKDASSNW